MAITRVQTAIGGGDGNQGTSVAAVFGSNVTSGNVIIVGIRNTGDTLTGVTDTRSTTYTLVGAVSVGSNDPKVWLYKGVLGSSGANTVTTAWSATSFPWVFAIEVSGLTGVVNTSDTQQVTGTTDLTTDAITTTVADTYIVMLASQPAFTTYTAGATFTLIDGTMPTNPNDFGGVQERILTATVSGFVPHFTSGSSNDAPVIVAAFEGSGGGGGSSVPKLMNQYRRRRAA